MSRILDSDGRVDMLGFVRSLVRGCSWGCERINICEGGTSPTTSSHTGRVVVRRVSRFASARRRTLRGVRFMRPIEKKSFVDFTA